MDKAYQSLYNQAVKLQFKFRDCIRNKDGPAGRELEAKVQKVVDEAKIQRNIRGIEYSIIDVQNLLKSTKDDELSCISTQDCNNLNQRYEEFRMKVRALPDY